MPLLKQVTLIEIKPLSLKSMKTLVFCKINDTLYLRKRLSEGRITLIKLKDIAEVVGVSIGTVSKALNNSHEISLEMTERIKLIAKEMGYIANSNARGLKTNRSYNIGVVYIDKAKAGLSHEYFSTMLSSIQESLRIKGYDLTFISNVVGPMKHTLLSHARYRRCDGVIIVTADFEDPEVIELIESNMTASYSRKGNPWDNAVIESFFAIIKREWLSKFKILNYYHANALRFEYIETFYNTIRIHKSIGYKTPIEYEKGFKLSETARLSLKS